MTFKIKIERSDVINLNLDAVITDFKKIFEADMFSVERTAKLNYLSGPRPEKLGVVTNVLRSSIKNSAEIDKSSIKGFIGFGPQAWYGRIHEEGLNGYRKRAFLAPAIEDNLVDIEKHILKSINDTLNGML